jgi:ammonium transporter, Amt family
MNSLLAFVTLALIGGGILLFESPLAAAENTPSLEERVAQLEAAKPAINSGDNAWMLVSSALVLMMTAPGLILFYGGLVRRKNVLSTMMHSLILMAWMSVLWAVFGYSMAFAEGNPIFGNPLTYFMLKDVGGAPNTDYAGSVPHLSFMLFQMMFAVITPALISGAMAERVKFSAYLVFMTCWAVVVYFPLAHMIWGKGGLFNWALGGKIPVLDFAGGTVVHISYGV